MRRSRDRSSLLPRNDLDTVLEAMDAEDLREAVREVLSFVRAATRVGYADPCDVNEYLFEEAWPGRFDAVVQTEKGDVPLAFIGLDALVKNKRASGRPKDLDDLDYLTRGD